MSTETAPLTKVCTKCGFYKPLGEFGPRKTGKNGLKSWCRPCETIHRRDWYRENPGAYRAGHLKRKYGISEEDYDRMLAEQDGKCAICRECDPGPKQEFFSVDHNHATGKVRALLCYWCNGGLGQFDDDPDLLFKAWFYLIERGHKHA